MGYNNFVNILLSLPNCHQDDVMDFTDESFLWHVTIFRSIFTSIGFC